MSQPRSVSIPTSLLTFFLSATASAVLCGMIDGHGIHLHVCRSYHPMNSSTAAHRHSYPSQFVITSHFVTHRNRCLCWSSSPSFSSLSLLYRYIGSPDTIVDTSQGNGIGDTFTCQVRSFLGCFAGSTSRHLNSRWLSALSLTRTLLPPPLTPSLNLYLLFFFIRYNHRSWMTLPRLGRKSIATVKDRPFRHLPLLLPALVTFVAVPSKCSVCRTSGYKHQSWAVLRVLV